MRTKILILAAVLVVGLGVAYQSLQPQEIKRNINDDLELVPEKNLKLLLVVPKFEKMLHRLKGLDAYKVAKSNGLEKDLHDYLLNRAEINEWPLKIAELLSGKLLESLLGKELIYATYRDGGYLVITKPRKSVRMSWRAVLLKGKPRRAFGYRYSLFRNGLSITFVGHLFIATNHPELMVSVLERVAKKPNLSVTAYLEHVKRDLCDIFGLVFWPEGKLLSFDKLEFFADGKLHMFLKNPSGFLGASLSRAKEPEKLMAREGAFLTVSLDGVKFERGDNWLRVKLPEYKKLSNQKHIREGLKALKGRIEFDLYGFRPSYTMQPIFCFMAEIDQRNRFALRDLTDWLFDPEGFIDWRIHEDIFGVWNLPTDKALPKPLRPYWKPWKLSEIDLEQEIPFKIIGNPGNYDTSEEFKGFAYVNTDILADVAAQYSVEVARHTDELSSATAKRKLAPVISSLKFGRFIGRWHRNGDTIFMTFSKVK